MNTTMADGAHDRLDAQIAEALFGQPGMSKMDVANLLRELRGDGPALLVGGSRGSKVQVAEGPWPEIDAILADAYSAGAVGLPFGGIARRAAVRAAVATLSAQPSPGGQGELREAAEFARSVLAEIYATYQVKIGPFASQAQLANVKLGAALAARQPVTMDDALAAGDGTLHGAIDHWQERALRAEAELAARQPVGEPVAWMTHHDEPMLFPTAAEAAAYCEDDEQPVPLFRSPAQAVDLGQFTDADVRAWVERNDLGGSFGSLTDARCAFDDARSAHLIDGEAVGNGR
ncbi:hypothetical protein [Stenotrophomonas maltophilia]|uniref:hypothetical protein n=1 Tax=Stenotrophomonas maltophilia TaxID=40324 RepID=UPI0006AC8E86|nr:hypothetical protein [Stenotrophomonas maltophilia]KOQ69943.1 hypothetical protein ABW43_07365 [Stenotrophomonas maltophilia]